MAKVKDEVPARMTAEEKRWRVESDLRTLKEADQIRKDRGRMLAAQSEAKRQMDALNKLSKGAGSKPKAKPPARTARKPGGAAKGRRR